MNVGDIINALEKLAPSHYAENFDNVGLLVGSVSAKVNGVLVTLDVTDEVIDEAISKKCNTIVTFHPLIFKGLKKLTGANRVERLVIKAIQNNLNIYAIHTNLDNQLLGVNSAIAQRLNLQNVQILMPKTASLYRLGFYVPNKKAEEVRNAVFTAGAGNIGNYSNCSFNIGGNGTFQPMEGSQPHIGEQNKLHIEPETRVEMVVPSHLKGKTISALKKAHPYEEVAYDLTLMDNLHQYLGMGQIGELNTEMNEDDFLKFVKQQLPTDCIRHSPKMDKKIKKIAVLGGSGSFAIGKAIASGADAFITADLKYHDFFLADNQILLTDVGHFESEQFTKKLLTDYLSEIFPNFAILNPKVKTNPVNYF